MVTLLILDLDETLVHPTSSWLHDRRPAFAVTGWNVYLRPGLLPFLRWCDERFTVAVWTSADADYAGAVVDQILPFKPEFLWSKRQCMPKLQRGASEVVWTKPLSAVWELGWSPERVVWLDNSPEKYAEDFDNGIAVDDFLGDPNDRVLASLLPCLDACSQAPDVRRVDKRAG